MPEEIPISRWTPKPPKTPFKWLNDPAFKFKGNAGKARFSDRPAPSATAFPGSIPGWDAGLTAERKAGIEARYGGGTPGYATVRSAPAAVAAPPVPSGNVVNPFTVPTAPATNPFTPGAAGPSGDIGQEARAEVGDNAAVPTVPGEVPYDTPAPTMLSGQDNRGTTGEQLGGGPGAPLNPITGQPVARTPEQRAAEAKAMHMANGGSEATWHQAQVAAGTRPPIDGRTGPDQQASHASADVRKSWGWPDTPEANQREIAGEMTAGFNTRNAAPQARWKQRFDDAHAKLRSVIEE